MGRNKKPSSHLFLSRVKRKTGLRLSTSHDSFFASQTLPLYLITEIAESYPSIPIKFCKQNKQGTDI